MSSNDLPRIRQALFTLDKNRTYKFDVNQTITIKNLKKMIVAAANLGKSGLKIFHKGTEYTHLDDSSIDELFPDLQVVDFTIAVVFVEEQDKEENIKLKLGKYCPLHNFKYPYFYCYECKSSICSMCLQEGLHKSHNYIEKYDYLQSSRNLVENIFYDMKDFLSGAKFDNAAIEEVRSRIKVEFFPQLADMVSKIEMKLCDLLDFFFENEKVSHHNMQQNVGLLKSHCSEGLDKLKNEIAIEDMMLDEDIFLTFDRKFRDISNEKGRIVNDAKKFEDLRKNMTSVVTVVDTVYNDIYNFLDKYLKDQIFNDTKSRIAETSISLVTKEDVLNRMLSDIKRKGGRFLTASKLGETPTSGFLKEIFNNINTEDKVRPFPLTKDLAENSIGAGVQAGVQGIFYF